MCREHKLPDEMHLRMRQSPASGCALRLLTGATLPLTRADSACVLRVPVLAESYLTHELEDQLGVSPLLRCLQALGKWLRRVGEEDSRMKGCGVAPNLGSCQLESALRVLSGSRAHCTCAAARAACVRQNLWLIWSLWHAGLLGALSLQLRTL